MKKVILTIILCGIIILKITGCNKEEVSIEELNQMLTYKYNNFPLFERIKEIADKIAYNNCYIYISIFINGDCFH